MQKLFKLVIGALFIVCAIGVAAVAATSVGVWGTLKSTESACDEVMSSTSRGEQQGVITSQKWDTPNMEYTTRCFTDKGYDSISSVSQAELSIKISSK
jgi:hypothetical protein